MSAGPFGAGGAELSVMIPTYNCAPYLAQTLASLEGQGIPDAEVVVVDDCSTEDDPEAVVAACGRPGLAFVRQPRNLGLVGNFNSCIERAERRWVHILHGDDFVLPGGYEALAAAATAVPQGEVVFGRCVTVDEAGIWTGMTKPIGQGPAGPLPYQPMDWRMNRLQFAGVVFQRQTALELGGFDRRYSHCADWHLWWRLNRSAPTAFTNACVGAYRSFAGSHTATLLRTAGNVRESLEFLHEVAAAEPDLGPELYRALFDFVLDQGTSFEGDDAAYLAHVRMLLAFRVGLPRWRKAARLTLRHVKARAQRRVGHERSW